MSVPPAKRPRVDAESATPTHGLSIEHIIHELGNQELRSFLLEESRKGQSVHTALADYYNTTRGISTEIDFKHHVRFVHHHFKPLRAPSDYTESRDRMASRISNPTPPDQVALIFDEIYEGLSGFASLGTKRNAIAALRTIGKLCFNNGPKDFPLYMATYALKNLTDDLTKDEFEVLVNHRYGSLRLLGDFMVDHPEEVALIRELDEEWEKVDKEAREKATKKSTSEGRQNSATKGRPGAREEEMEEETEVSKEREKELKEEREKWLEEKRQELMDLMVDEDSE